MVVPPMQSISGDKDGTYTSYIRGSGPEFSSIFFWREAKFFEALRRTKKQTDREQHKALFLTT